jgi:hypothetical protein
MWDDLEQKARFFQRSHHDLGRQRRVLVTHRADCRADWTEVKRADEGVACDLQVRRGELLRKAPELAAASDGRMGIQEHRVGIVARLASETNRNHLR